ncbi:MAG TPA: 4-(cytidine 5'-diphospho)-2-C-methyl-D-erythritol kinase [Gemmatimonadota bacterium]|nr:4-(cytidine 5'-diphospho)-2-C-methyl-D-erythritol kinase [Gemmatimonadota bacterium]
MNPSALAPVREVWRAPAKINLWLEILGRRTDGYHDIDTCYQAIDLADTVVLKPSDEAGVSCRVEGPFAEGVPTGPENLAAQAAVLLAERTGHEPRVAITIVKEIPAGAGLGGGSSDAAAVLVALAHRFAVPDPEDTLVELAAELGADVPFFLEGGTQRATGIGERLEPVPMPEERWGILVWPGVAVPTRWAYEEHDRAVRDRTERDAPGPGRFRRENAFVPLVMARWPAIARAVGILREAGAEDRRLSGSGSAVYALFRDPASRDVVFDRARKSTILWDGVRIWPFGLVHDGVSREELSE